MYFSAMYIDWVDTARRSSAGGGGHQTTLRWQEQVFIYTRLSRAYLALARLSCILNTTLATGQWQRNKENI